MRLDSDTPGRHSVLFVRENQQFRGPMRPLRLLGWMERAVVSRVDQHGGLESDWSCPKRVLCLK